MGIVFVGSQPIGHACLSELIKMNIPIKAVFTFTPDKHEKWSDSVDTLAKENDIPLLFVDDLNSKKINEINPDLILVVGYRKIIPIDVLDIPKFGVVGLHASLLPHLRGQAPINWSIINGDKKTGITMFVMNKGIDSGDIIDQRSSDINEDDTIITIKERIQKLAIELVHDNVSKILNDVAEYSKQPKDGTYGCARIPEDGKIDWGQKTQKIFNLIRASEPVYAAFSFFNSKKLFILEARPIEKDIIYYGTPGQVGMTCRDDTVDVITGDGALKIIKVKYENEEAVSAKEILKSSRMRLS